ncbi:DUF2007 domain-containing protein [Marisediminitalea aggregata]|jgi:hypothetical protein|uniref:putative signal transducing protein n=1 Tax=Marisediminitalea aggregata TaxID=634436 RepID=UPI0020CD9938|nr:DUF2007 domain-containing protein [Marisediminitalea aggregata]MCP9477621.1 DUF2007 domain-containing protein [Marisediminitalea aggregata]
MIRLCQSDSAFTIQQYYDALQAQGIGCLIRNQFISGAAGDLPIQDTQPELWLMDKDDLTMAKMSCRQTVTKVNGYAVAVTNPRSPLFIYAGSVSSLVTVRKCL